MKALTLWRPWARFVVNGDKRIENRPWAPPGDMLGEVVAIHAGETWSLEGAEFIEKVLGKALALVTPRAAAESLHPTGIIGTAKIIGWTTVEGTPIRSIERLALTDRDREWMFGPFCWVLRDARQFKRPVACRGMQKLWTVPEAVEREVMAQVAANG